MARKETITKQDIMNAAFEILQEEGIEQVTARKLAAKASCSTQPIFRVYKNMDELIGELFGEACDFFNNYYAGIPRQTVTPFVNLGCAYIKIQAASGQGCRNAGELFMKMWIFIHGAACMSLTGDYDLSEKETVELLKDSYHSLK